MPSYIWGDALTPLQIRKMQLVRPPARDRDWLRERLAIVSRRFGCDVTIAADGSQLEARPVSYEGPPHRA